MKRINCFVIVCAIGMGWLTACGGMKDSTETSEQIPTSQYTIACEEEKEVLSGEERKSEQAATSKEITREGQPSEPAETSEFIEGTEPTEASETIETSELREAAEHEVVLEQTEAMPVRPREEQPVDLKPEESESIPVAEKPVEPSQNPEESKMNPAEAAVPEEVKQPEQSKMNPAEAAVPEEVKQPEHVHDFYESWWTYPDCVNSGYYFIRCRGCDYEETGKDAAKLAPLGHQPDEGAVVKAPTCQHTGVREHHCRVCGAALADSEIPADPTAHVWVEDELGVYCDVCNQEG